MRGEIFLPVVWVSVGWEELNLPFYIQKGRACGSKQSYPHSCSIFTFLSPKLTSFDHILRTELSDLPFKFCETRWLREFFLVLNIIIINGVWPTSWGHGDAYIDWCRLCLWLEYGLILGRFLSRTFDRIHCQHQWHLTRSRKTLSYYPLFCMN